MTEAFFFFPSCVQKCVFEEEAESMMSVVLYVPRYLGLYIKRVKWCLPDRSKAEMDLKELSESVQQQSAPVPLISPKRQIRSRFQLNLDKTIESCKAQLGMSLDLLPSPSPPSSSSLFLGMPPRWKESPILAAFRSWFNLELFVLQRQTSIHGIIFQICQVIVQKGFLNSSGCILWLWQPADSRCRL